MNGWCSQVQRQVTRQPRVPFGLTHGFSLGLLPIEWIEIRGNLRLPSCETMVVCVAEAGET